MGIVMLAASATVGTVAMPQSPAADPIPTESTEISTANPTDLAVGDDTLKTEKKVREYFSDAPIMADIAYCESTFRQYDTNGNVLRGHVNGADVGVMQINEYYHAATAQKLGYDLHTTEGNLDYARYLYETQGTRPWVHSEHCWGSKHVEVALR